MKIVIRIMFYA